MTELEKTTAFGGAAILVVALALGTAPSRSAPDAFFDVGETFFPEFTDPEAATSLEVVEFDEDTAAAAVFRVANRDGLWTIPSHHDYPADGEERLAQTAAGMIAITKDDFRSDNVTDHEAFGVIDPLDEGVSTLRGRGRRVTFRGASEEVLADLVIGNRVEGRPGLNFVRVPDQNRVYAARTDIGISTRFNDWIETNLLGVERDDVKRVELNEYEIDERTGSVRRRGEFIVDWVEDDVWTANDVPDGKEVDYVQMNLLVGGLMGLEIVGVRPKPEGLSGNLRQAFEERTITNADLQTMQARGFYPTQTGEMLSNEGELKVRTDLGVLYTLRFGEIVYGSGNAVAIGDETSDDAETGDGENRYVLINAEFDPEALPEPERPANRDFENKAESQWTDADRENRERADLHARWDRRTADGRARAEELATRFARWYYVVSAGSYNRVRKSRDDFLKDVEEDEVAEPVEPSDPVVPALPSSPASPVEPVPAPGDAAPSDPAPSAADDLVEAPVEPSEPASPVEPAPAVPAAPGGAAPSEPSDPESSDPGPSTPDDASDADAPAAAPGSRDADEPAEPDDAGGPAAPDDVGGPAEPDAGGDRPGPPAAPGGPAPAPPPA